MSNLSNSNETFWVVFKPGETGYILLTQLVTTCLQLQSPQGALLQVNYFFIRVEEGQPNLTFEKKWRKVQA